MAAASSVAALSSLHFHPHIAIFSKPSRRLSLSLFTPRRRSLPLISSSSAEFNISFAPPKPKTQNDASSSSPTLSPGQLFIPWIVRGEDGNLKLQSHPPARVLHALADAKTRPKKKKKQDSVKSDVKNASVKPKAGPVALLGKEPRFSKAARRYYNEHIKESTEQRLSKVLAAAGVASRRASEELIFDGKVTVNGSVCKTPQTRVDPWKDMIYVNGSRLPKRLPPKVYLALNKPKGYICSAGEKESKSVMTLFDDYFKSWDKINPGVPIPRLFTVGRLDVATTGLIIVTNDGDFAQALAHPSSNLTKEYIATVEGDVSKRQLLAISEGTVIDGVHCTPDSVELLPRQPNISRQRLRIVVHEGRHHEVRELVKNAKLELHALKRVRIGGYRLPPDIGHGKHVELKQGDLKAVGWKP